MANNIGTLVTSPIRPQGELDQFPTAYANELLGGHHQVVLISERNAIPDSRRLEGMTCYVQEAGVTYQLQGGTDNAYWRVYGSEGGGTGPSYLFVDEEIPTQNDTDPRLYTLSRMPIPGSLKVYQDGIRLRGGLTNDYLFIAPASFRISDERDFDPSDCVMADYRTLS